MLLISDTYFLGLPFAYKGDLPVGTRAEPVQLKAADFRDCAGVYYTPGGNTRPKIAALAMHPRVDFTRHYCIPHFVTAGIACLGLNTRCFNNDFNAIHEQLILDVNAGVQFLKERGAEKVILFGNSGGGSLSAMFQAQAQLPQGQRLAETPAGERTKLNDVEMVPADAFIAVSAHKGQGLIMNECIDPSVVDEADPFQTDTALDMYNPSNGFAPPPQQSHYSKDFIGVYRSAQLARVRKLDQLAHELIEDARKHEQIHASDDENLTFEQRQHAGRRGAFEKVMVIYRTMANLHYTDHRIDPSNRKYGSLLSDRPDLMNMQYAGFGRVLSPQAWLSTWSGLSSRANLPENLSKLDVPVMVIAANRDKEIYPGDAGAIWNSARVKDKVFHEFDAEHYFEPEFGAPYAPDVTAVMSEVVSWVLERFD